jgi:DNA adenine methylase
MESKKSFLRWAGSKQKIIPYLKQYWINNSDRYIEPFMGSAQLFFSLNPNTAILNDINSELIQTYLQVKKNPYPVYSILKEMKVSKNEYYRIRAIQTHKLGANQRAARFIYLNQLCFNGIYRTNLKGEFNVPFSGENQLKTFSLDVLVEASKKLKVAKIYSEDFEKLIRKNISKNDFIYLDPPFAVSNRRIFRQYGPDSFGLEDLSRLNKLLNFIDKKGAKFLLSYAYCKESITLINNWNSKKIFVQRNIAGFSKFRRKSAEILISNIDIKNYNE